MSVVEGLTEFLPVSSTFHLLQTAHFLSLPQTEFMKLFEVVIQAGAVCAIFFLFSRQLWFSSRLYLKLFVSTIPALIFGFLLHDFIKNTLFVSPQTTTIAFIVVGIIFLVVEWYVGRHSYRTTKGLLDVDMRMALVIGLIQALALVPGVSRSGSVIAGMLLLGYRREEAAAYSLALSVPTIFAASAYDLFKYVKVNGVTEFSTQIDIVALGFIVSFVVGYFAARWMVRYLQGHTLKVFGIYRIIAGIILLVLASRGL